MRGQDTHLWINCDVLTGAGGGRWCGLRQPGVTQYTDPAAKTHRS
jgi:hypothetical protein